jgi:GR25 family glycosyltransferase involved in LPS biosynthesis
MPQRRTAACDHWSTFIQAQTVFEKKIRHFQGAKLTAAYYPIILFAFNRPWHTEQVLNALQKNELAEKSDLFIYVDGPRENASQKEVKAVEDVRKLVSGKRWCKTVNIKIAEKNIGCRNSILNGVSEVIARHEGVIVLEDDIVTSPHFLNYMNKCLEHYKNFKSVFSISGMNLPENRIQLPEDYEYDVYASLRQLNSGWGTWKDRWNLIDWNLNFTKYFFKNPSMINAFKRGGDDLIPMLMDQVEGRIDAWDIQFTYNHFKFHAVSIIPRYSYVDNIGGDGTGMHHLDIHAKLRFDLSRAVKKPRLLDEIYEDERIINSFYNAFCSKKRPLWKKAVNRVSRMLGGKNVFTVKKKVYD